jgi:hypothetical protein
MNEDFPQFVKARKLAHAWVAASMARNIAIQSLKDLPQQSDQNPLIKVLNVTLDLMDEMLREIYPDLPITSILQEPDSDLVM